jgi:hypothetical protein
MCSFLVPSLLSSSVEIQNIFYCEVAIVRICKYVDHAFSVLLAGRLGVNNKLEKVVTSKRPWRKVLWTEEIGINVT